MKSWLSIKDPQNNDEDIGSFYVDFDFMENHDKEDLVSYLMEYEK